MKTKSVFRLIIISFLLMVFTGSLVQAEDPNTNDFIDSVVPGQLETEGLVFEEAVTDTEMIADANTSAFTWDYTNAETGAEVLTDTLTTSTHYTEGFSYISTVVGFVTEENAEDSMENQIPTITVAPTITVTTTTETETEEEVELLVASEVYYGTQTGRINIISHEQARVEYDPIFTTSGSIEDVLVFAPGVSAISASQAVNYKAIILHPMSGFEGSFAEGVWEGKQAGGAYNQVTDANSALLWSGANTGYIELDPGEFEQSWASDIWHDQQVGVGWGGTPGEHALLWSGNGGSVTDLNPDGFQGSWAYGIFENEQVGVGYGSDTNYNLHAILWSGSAEDYVDLHPEGFTESECWGISDSKQAGYGYGSATDSFYHALLWSSDANDYVDLNPSGFTESWAIGIWEDQQTGYGYGSATGDNYHALLWSGNGEDVNDLNPAGFTESECWGISDNQQVGFGYGGATGGNYHALLWLDSGESCFDLHSGVLPEVYVSSFAVDVDLLGNIVGSAITTSGEEHAVLWQPLETPDAKAGPDQTVIDTDKNGSESVTLDGSGSSDDGNIISWVWTDDLDNEIAYGENTTAELSVGIHTITLKVTDDDGLTDTDTVTIAIESPPNQPPVADAGPDQIETDTDENGSEIITLNGSGSYDDSTIISWVWIDDLGNMIPDGEVTTAELSVGMHTITLVIADDEGLTDANSVTVTVESLRNLLPTAEAGGDQTVLDTDDNGSEMIMLDGSGSDDPDGVIVSWEWTDDLGTMIADGETTTIELNVGTHTITLIATDDDDAVDTDTVTITIEPLPNQEPVADAGPDQTVTDTDYNGSENITLDGSGSFDNDGEIVAWEWTNASGNTIADGEIATVEGRIKTYTVILTVTDNEGFTDTDTVIITVKPGPKGSIVPWGKNDCGLEPVPQGDDFIDLACGYYHDLALRSDGSVEAWGSNYYGQCDVPEIGYGEKYVDIACGKYHSLALTSDGRLVAWGRDKYGACKAPWGDGFVAIACGDYHNLAIRDDGSLVSWGWGFYGQCDVPEGYDFVDISAGWAHSLALKKDGSLVQWGKDNGSSYDPPEGNDFIGIAGGYFHDLAIKEDGSLKAWGWNKYHRLNVPEGEFIDIALGKSHSVALRADGSLIAWGRNTYGECNVPQGDNFLVIASSFNHSLALKSSEP